MEARPFRLVLQACIAKQHRFHFATSLLADQVGVLHTMRLVAGDCMVAAEDVALLGEVTPELGGLRAPWVLAWAARRHRLAVFVFLDDLLNGIFFRLLFRFLAFLTHLLHLHPVDFVINFK